MQPGDRLVCALVGPLAVETSFVAWPLHVTVVPWFRMNLPTAKLAAGLQRLLGGMKPFRVTVHGEAHFGHRGRKLVSLVALPTPLITIEAQVRDFLKAHEAWIADESTKRHFAYRPHVTLQRTRRLAEGEGFVCGRLYIIEQLGDAKIVTAAVELAA